MIAVTDPLVQYALENGLVSLAEIEAAAARAPAEDLSETPAEALVDALMTRGALDAGRLAEALAAEAGLPSIDCAMASIAPETLALIPADVAAMHRVLPLSHDDGSVRLAVADPFDVGGIDSVGYLTGREVVPLVARADALRQAWQQAYGDERSPVEALSSTTSVRTAIGATVEREEWSEDDAPIITLVQSIIDEAVARRASDIHLEPLEQRFRVRYRIDGVLLEGEGPPKRWHLPVISRVKIMANISIAEKRLPQDGRIQMVVAGRPLDLRVSSLPTAHGESVVMRLLDQEDVRIGLDELGFWPDDRVQFERLIARPDGMVLVTGPTGSGKTTTLYSCLHHLNQSDRKIITVEDPVEYQLAGINQVPVRSEIGMNFASALRAMLRQAPNIVMVGEIRDGETADVAINASLTGHMVFSTLHTNDAVGAVVRLLDLGVKPFLVSTSLRAVLAQRLVRRVCERCAQDHQPDANELRALSLTPAEVAGARFRKGAGCEACNGTGYRGRLGIFELLVIDEEMQQLIYRNAGLRALREHARSVGMRIMREDGTRKVIAGLTTADEVVSITVDDAS